MNPAAIRGLLFGCFLQATLGGLGAAPPEEKPRPVLLERSISSSRQFWVYGRDRSVRQFVASEVESIKSDVRRVLDYPDQWTAPIVVVLRSEKEVLPGFPRDRVRLLWTDAGLKVQVDLVHKPGTPPPLLEPIVRAILVELEYRGRSRLVPHAEVAYPPQWMVKGVLGILDHADYTVESAIYERLMKSGTLPDLEEYLKTDPDRLDSFSRGVYEAQAAALLLAILDTPNGKQGLLRILQALPETRAIAPDLLVLSLPALGSDPDAIMKRWALSVARLAVTERFQFWSLAESERRLADALRVRFSSAEEDETEELPLEEFQTYRAKAQWQEALAQTARTLSGLQGRMHPLIAPALTEYLSLIPRIQKGKVEGVAERMAQLADLRRDLSTLAEGVEDTMNWIQASQMGTVSGSFDPYLRTAEAARKKRARTDPISQYLDLLELEFE
jgi:hypothetical protein